LEVTVENRKITVILALTVFVLSLTACAGAPVQDTKAARQKSPKQIKFEKEEEGRSFLIKSITSFSGLVAGGLIGLLTSKKENAVTSAIGGCIAGGALGFGLGMMIFENSKPSPAAVNDSKVKESFQEYRNMQLKE
jgi:outer membrane lipoprotein SlyB